MDQVLTLIAPPGGLSIASLHAARDALARIGATVGAPAWLAPEEAADLPFAGLATEQADAAARVALADRPVDMIAQSATGRRKRLLIADMDSTIVTTETLDELAGQAGIKDRIAAITKRAMNGELDFEGALRERVGMLKGLGRGHAAYLGRNRTDAWRRATGRDDARGRCPLRPGFGRLHLLHRPRRRAGRIP